MVGDCCVLMLIVWRPEGNCLHKTTLRVFEEERHKSVQVIKVFISTKAAFKVVELKVHCSLAEIGISSI